MVIKKQIDENNAYYEPHIYFLILVIVKLDIYQNSRLKLNQDSKVIYKMT